MTVTAFTASAKDEVPFKFNWFITAITSHVDDDDGSYVETSVQVGNGTQLGRFTGADTVLVEGPGDYSVELDPASGSPAAVVEFAGTTTKTAANGDTLVFDYVGRVFIPLDENFNLTPRPWRLENVWTVISGTGRFEGSNWPRDERRNSQWRWNLGWSRPRCHLNRRLEQALEQVVAPASRPFLTHARPEPLWPRADAGFLDRSFLPLVSATTGGRP
jgi:hypothetical protein